MKKIITHISLLAVLVHATVTQAVGQGTTNSTGASMGTTNSTGAGIGRTNSTGGSMGTTNSTGGFRTDNASVPKLSLEGIVKYLGDIMNSLVYVILGAALVMFLYGILKLSFIDGQKPEAREQSRKFMIWGIVSLFVMVSVWGLVKILQATVFGGSPLLYPQLK